MVLWVVCDMRVKHVCGCLAEVGGTAAVGHDAAVACGLVFGVAAEASDADDGYTGVDDEAAEVEYILAV
jgi:hypothetical protein